MKVVPLSVSFYGSTDHFNLFDCKSGE